MKRTLKKSMSILLTFTLLFGSFSFGFADVDWADFVVKAKAEETATSGTCGENLTWSFDESTGTLTISGTGAMEDWSQATTYAPWYDIHKNIKSVIISDGVTRIGGLSFYNCIELTTAKISESVSDISDLAFAFCLGLKNIIVDKKNTSYSNDENGVLFNKDKTKLIQYTIGSLNTSYEIPNSVTSIGLQAFAYCDNLKYITIPKNVTYIGDVAFYWCNSLTNIKVDSENTVYSNDEYGVLFNKDKTELIQYPLGGLRERYDIPHGVKSIGYGAFSDCDLLTDVIIPTSVSSIGPASFCNCDGLKSISIPNGVTNISYDAFVYCKNLTSVEIPDSVICIGEEAFAHCEKLEYVHIPASVNEFVTYEGKSDITVDILGDSKAYICSNTEECLAKKYAEANEIEFRLCNSHKEVEKESTTEPIFQPEETTDIPVTTKPTMTETTTTASSTTKPIEVPSTTKDVSTEHSTTKPVVTEPSTTKPVETTKPTTVPTTKPIEEPTTVTTTKSVETTKPTTTEPIETTKPATTEPSTTKPVSTTKPEPIEEEIIKKPSTSTVKYGETLILHADFANIPEGAKIEWSVEGNGVTIAPSADGKTCAVTSTATGDVTITAKYTDSNGVEHISEQEIKSNASFWQKIVSFFKNLFGINRIIEQTFKF